MKNESRRKYFKQGLTSSEYSKIHYLLSKHTKFKVCEKCNKHSKRTEWALNEGEKYTYDIRIYKELCVPCHRKSDVTDHQIKTARKTAKSFKGKEGHGSWMIGKSGKNSPKSIKIVQMSMNKEFIKVWDSLTEAANECNIRFISSLSNNIAGRTHSCNGFKWCLLKDYKNED